MSVLSFLAVGLGGALGALCRHKASTFMKLIFKSAFPWPTFFINLCACTIAGAALASSTATNLLYGTDHGLSWRLLHAFDHELRSCRPDTWRRARFGRCVCGRDLCVHTGRRSAWIRHGASHSLLVSYRYYKMKNVTAIATVSRATLTATPA